MIVLGYTYHEVLDTAPWQPREKNVRGVIPIAIKKKNWRSDKNYELYRIPIVEYKTD